MQHFIQNHVENVLYSITRQQIFDSPKLTEFSDDNFKFDDNGRRLSRRVENTVGKGEIARYEQFLLFPQCFQKARFPEASKGVIVWEWVNPDPKTQIMAYCRPPRHSISRNNGDMMQSIFNPLPAKFGLFQFSSK